MHAVQPKKDCPHIGDHFTLNSPNISFMTAHLPCSTCHDKSENWICLKCFLVGCSRYVNSHAIDHYKLRGHCITVSCSDFSFWCYKCASYIASPVFRSVRVALHNSKFPLHPENAHGEEEDDDERQQSASSNHSEGSGEESEDQSGENVEATLDALFEDESDDQSFDANAPPPQYSDSDSDSSDDVLQARLHVLRTMLAMGDTSMLPVLEVPDEKVLEPLDLTGVARAIKEGRAKRIIAMTGAGISVAAGIPDFRSPGTGLYHNLQKYNLPHPEAVFEMDYFRSNPQPFYTLAAELWPGNYRPTTVHYFIRLLWEKGLLLRNFTQNIDTLERVAGVPGEALVEAHGSFATARCIDCKTEVPIERVRQCVFATPPQVPRCHLCQGLIKPDIVFFGESLPKRFFDLTEADFPECDFLLVIGTSLKVYPFAALVGLPNKLVPRVLINREQVNEYDPLQHLLGVRGASDGFLFGHEKNYRDVFVQGDCQEGVQRLVELLGWEDDLRALANEKASAPTPQPPITHQNHSATENQNHEHQHNNSHTNSLGSLLDEPD